MSHSLSRRHMLFAGAAFAGLAACSKPADSTGASASPVAAAAWPIGVQLFTVKAELATDAPGTLKKLKDLGIDVVETAGTNGGTAATLLQQIKDAGLTCRSSHTNMPALLADIDKEIADAKTFGAEWLVCSSPKPANPLPGKKDWVIEMTENMTADAWKFNADQLAAMAPKVKAAGLKFAYHNHPMEFHDLGGGQTGYDLITASTPDLRLEMDIGWVVVGGADPVAMLNKYAGRVDLLHVKDMRKDPAGPFGFYSTELGNGVIDWPAVFKAAKTAGASGYFVEQEAPYIKPIFDSLKISTDYLKAMPA